VGNAPLRLETVTALLASWLMAVEFVHDLKEPPATPQLRPLLALGPFAKESRRLAVRFREQLPDAYEELANDLQGLLSEDRTGHHAAALGTIDTFRFEEATVRAAAIDALRGGESRPASSRPRTRHSSFRRSRERSGRSSASVAFFEAATVSTRPSLALRSGGASSKRSMTSRSSSRERSCKMSRFEGMEEGRGYVGLLH
jgi:hypothetical protein